MFSCITFFLHKQTTLIDKLFLERQNFTDNLNWNNLNNYIYFNE